MKPAPHALLAIDAGTGGGKCVVFDASGRRLAVHRQPWSYRVSTNPNVSFIKEFEFDAKEFWGLLCQCITGAIKSAGIDPREIAGVSTTAQREGCVFLNAAGKEIYAGPNLDARGFAEGMEVIDRLGDRLYDITGHSAPFIFPVARLLWHRTHRPEPVARLLMINDWLVYRLTGTAASEPSNATESMLFDLRQRAWSSEILERLDISPGILPPIHASGAPIGTVTKAAAAETGLCEGTPVFIGGADTQCSLLGAGVIRVGQVGATLGTTTPVQMVLDRPAFDADRNLWAGSHVVESRWVLESNAGDTGDAYLWLLRLLGGEHEPERLFQLGEELASSETPPKVFSFLGPTVFNLTTMRPDRPGGVLFPFPMFHHRPDRSDLLRSFLDSIGFAIRANCEQISAVSGVTPSSLTLSGGLSRSNALVRRVADIAGIAVRVAREPESAAMGCAILIALGRGTYTSAAAAVESMVEVVEVPPNPEAHEGYQPLYAKWRELYASLENTSL